LADDRTVSTRELVELVAQGAGVDLRMFPVPPSILAAGFRAIGQRATSDRLLGTLELDTSLTRATLDWTPPLSLEEGIVRAVRDSR
jgi:UDP-glucose 4-epimerase